MPDWTAPFHMPQWNDDEYYEKKAEYTAKYGYTVTVPALSDIFHFGKPNPMTDQEKTDWKNENWEAFSADRMYELEIDKKHKKERMMAMLGSPTPEVFAKLGAILTAVDDAQDAISTLAAIARLSRKIAPKIVGRLLGGPIGLLLTINDILNLVTSLGTAVAFGLMSKRYKEEITGGNPFSKKARIKRLKKGMSWKPTFADVIQALQTTDQVFGVGVSLGPITGLVQDIFHGTVRESVGQKVSYKLSPHFIPEWMKLSYKTVKSLAAGLAPPYNSPDDDILLMLQAEAMCQESIMAYHADWDPLEQIDNIEGSEILCPIPDHPTTLWAMAELDIEVEDVIGWPVIDKEWASPDELTEVYAPLVTDNIQRFVERHNHDSMGALACSCVADAALYQMANLAGEENVEYDYTVASKVASGLLAYGIMPAPDYAMDPVAFENVVNYLQQMENDGLPVSTREFIEKADFYGFELRSSSYL